MVQKERNGRFSVEQEGVSSFCIIGKPCVIHVFLNSCVDATHVNAKKKKKQKKRAG
jgi:hypothetical protein